MCAIAIVILHVRKEYVAQVSLAEDDDMIKAFPSDRADQPFSVSILPWRARRGWSVANAHGAKPSFEKHAIDAVTITDDIPRRGFPAAGLGVAENSIWPRPFRRSSPSAH